jgi:pyruvate dehydrogenase E1 component alpha subunit
MHLCIGQEAIAVGVCEPLLLQDKVFSNHRAHGHYLAKGGNLNAMVAELYGRVTGCCGGRGGSMHLIDLDVGFMGATPIVGGTIPLAVGSAWASKLQQSDQVTVVFFGDGCFEEGVVHESMNFAALHKLPIVFVCENNKFSVYTRLEERQPGRAIHQVAKAHGLAAYHGDGNDVEEVVDLAGRAIADARAGKGPQFLEFSTYRWREHCGPNYDHELEYRSKDEIDLGVESCPVTGYLARMKTRDANFSSVAEIFENEIALEISAAFDYAMSSDKPSSCSAKDKLYA